MDVTHTPIEMGYDRFQLCTQFDMKIKLIPIIYIFINHLVSKVPKTLFVDSTCPFPCG